LVTAENVERMAGQRDVDGLIRVLQGDGDPKVRALAALALGRLGDPRARVVLQNALMSGEPQVMGAASSAIGQLEARLATGMPASPAASGAAATPITQEKLPEELTKHKQEGCRGRLWKAIYTIGIISLSIGGLFITLAVLTSGSSVVDWAVVLTDTVIFMGIGGLLMYLSTRPVKPKETTENEKNLEI
jgi:HEAT repeat protein